MGGLPPHPCCPVAPMAGMKAGVRSGSGEYTHLGPPGTVLAKGRAGRGGRDRETEQFVSQGFMDPSHRVLSSG